MTSLWRALMGHFTHIPVLYNQVLGALCPTPGGVFVDCTAGLGGHAEGVARVIGAVGTVVLIDLDEGNLSRAAERIRGLPDGPSVRTVHGNFSEAHHHLRKWGMMADMVLADLGFASTQVDDPARGLSFMRDGPLDMRLNQRAKRSAADLVAELSEAELEKIIREWGEERHSRRVARAIVEARRQGAIVTTQGLAEVVRSVVPRGPGDHIDPATRTFQGLRIAVNDELGNLEVLLEALVDGARGLGARWLNEGARLALISFHSLEDRLVKRAMGEIVRSGLGVEVGEQPTVADEVEAKENPRSRSAKLRAVRLCTRG